MEDPEAVAEPILCPFCGYKAEGDYQIMLHMETQHPENGESPFVATDDASVAALMSLQGEDDVQYVNCPVEGCGEALLLTELDSHVEMHEEEGNGSGGESDEHSSKRLKIESQIGNFFDTKLSYALRNLDDPSDDGHTINEKSSHDLQTAAKNTWKSILKMPDTSSKTSPSSKDTPKANSSKKRLGKSELGPHAHEKQMPAWLVKLLKEKDGEMATIYVTLNGKQKRIKYCPNQTAEILPVIEQFLEQDEATSYAYTCDPAVRHVSKLKREGGFCGYRNIQVMCSYIIGAQSQGHEIFNGKIPTIFDIQEYIESAWDMGINSQGRVETGGIRGTRKYIGTPDAQAMFCSLGIACDAQGIKPKAGQRPAYELLFTAVENYFINGCTDYDLKVRTTTLPPIYFQHPGHSLTIVGFEKQKDGTRNLIVFDPMFHDAVDIVKLIGMDFKHKYPGDKLKAYRRGTKYLKKYNEFELLKLTPPKRPEVIEAAITEQGV